MDPEMPSPPPGGTPDRPTWDALDAFFAGELDGAAAEVVQRYLDRYPDAERIVRSPGAFVPGKHVLGHASDLDSAWRAMEARLAEAARDAGNAVVRPASRRLRDLTRTPWTRRPLARVAGLAAAALVAAGVWQWRGRSSDNGALVATAYATRAGQRATATLSDGSTVLLGPASRLRVRAVGRDVREVLLDGEAYFTVHGQPSTPFVVHAGDGVVRVLGTQFSVRRYADDSTVRVVVASGRVGLRARTDNDGVGVVLGASDAAQLGPRNRVVVTRGIALDDDLAWRTGQLRVRNAPVSSVLAELRRMYDVDITASDSVLAGTTVTITSHDTTLGGVLDVLSHLLNVDVQRTGRRVVLVPQTSR